VAADRLAAAGRDAPASAVAAPAAAGPSAADQLARWLLLAVIADLVVTRFAVRLAIFIPKGEPWATAGALLGRLGAAVDALVPLLGLLLLAALLVRAGRSGDRLLGASLVAVALVAAAGLALVFLPPVPLLAVGPDLAVVAVALAAGLRALGAQGIPLLARGGVALLALAIGLAAASRLGGGIAASVAGEVAFLLGAALSGAAGLSAARRGRVGLAAPALGAALAVGSLGMAAAAPLMWASLAIWSTGLGSSLPALAIAPALGLAVAGLPGLALSRPRLAVGTATVLAAGYDLAASGLLLAGLLGLLVASGTEADE